MGPPQVLAAAKPRSSVITKRILGAPAGAVVGFGYRVVEFASMGSRRPVNNSGGRGMSVLWFATGSIACAPMRATSADESSKAHPADTVVVDRITLFPERVA